jgi:nicotinate-nucleotide adenylyltransferase
MGHLIMAEQALHEFGLDKILFIPTGISHFKDQNVVLDKEIRVRMTAGAIKENPNFELSTIEADRPGNSYTYETLNELKTANPETELYLIIGADNLFQIEYWKEPAKIMADAVIIVAVRSGQNVGDLEDKADRLKEMYKADVRLLKMPYIDISSTDIRQRIKEGKSIRYFVADDTRKYIEDNNLYR